MAISQSAESQAERCLTITSFFKPKNRKVEVSLFDDDEESGTNTQPNIDICKVDTTYTEPTNTLQDGNETPVFDKLAHNTNISQELLVPRRVRFVDTQDDEEKYKDQDIDKELGSPFSAGFGFPTTGNIPIYNTGINCPVDISPSLTGTPRKEVKAATILNTGEVTEETSGRITDGSQDKSSNAHQKPGQTSDEDDVPLPRKRSIILDTVDDSLPKQKLRDDLFSDDDIMEPPLKLLSSRSSRSDSQEKDELPKNLEDVSKSTTIDKYVYNHSTVVDYNQELTVGSAPMTTFDDADDEEERNKYLECKASEISQGFKAYVDCYYRYRNTFSFPPWLDVKKIKDMDGNSPLNENYNPSTLWIPPTGHKWAIAHKSGHYTECMRQWWTIKQQYFDSLLFFKMGRFYELFYHDACIIQELCNLRWMGSECKPHVGFPEKSIHVYASACVDAGYRVIVIEQTETPQQLEKRNKETGITERAVKREICEIITPGTVVRPEMLGNQSRPLVLLAASGEELLMTSIDVSLSRIRYGDVAVTKDWGHLRTIMIHLCPAEVVLESSLMDNIGLLQSIKSLPYPPEITCHKEAENEGILFSKVEGLDKYKCVFELTESYLKSILLDKLIEYCTIDEFCTVDLDVMRLDVCAITHLELFYNQEGSRINSLFEYLNKTSTAFGERLLREWLLRPLLDVSMINKRSEAIEFLLGNYSLVTNMQRELTEFPDMERCLGRILNNAANCYKKAIYFDDGIFSKLHELYILLLRFEKLESVILKFFEECKAIHGSEPIALFQELKDEFIFCSEDCNYFHNMIEVTGVKTCQSNRASWTKSIAIHESITTVMNKLNETLDRIKVVCRSATFVNCKFRFEIEMNDLDFKRYQDKFGTNLEVTSTRHGFVRIRNADVLSALDELEMLEFSLKESEEEFYQFIVRLVHEKSFKFCKLISIAALIDCLASLTTVVKNSPLPMSRPIVHPKGGKRLLNLVNSTYPLVHNPVTFVPNDVCLDNESSLMIITGPNMGGKSTLLRQVAITSIMAQIGSFVNATKCEMNVVDAIFTRLGASDNLLQGKSTFLVELQDVSSLLAQGTVDSLAIVDELGRGTSTYDGTAIAVATMEKIAQIGCRCIFTTHFRDVCAFATNYSNVVMYHMSARLDEDKQTVEFLYKLIEGTCPDSYGLYVAKLAGIPERVLECARNASLRFMNKKMIKDILAAYEHNNVEVLQDIYSHSLYK